MLALAHAGAAQPSGKWPGAGFPSAGVRWLQEREIYPAGRPLLDRRLDATVVFDRRTPWSEGRALRQIRKTAATLEPCGVALGSVALARAEFPAEFRAVDVREIDPQTGVPVAVARLAALLPSGAPRPAGFLVGAVRGTTSLAVSYGTGSRAERQSPHADTAWISYRSHWLPRRDEAYSPLAHEFAHLLCRCGHVGGKVPHLLHGARNFLSSRVLPEHCDRILTSPLLRDIDE